MKKITQLFVLMLTFLMWCGSYAQVASYGFSHSIGTFTPNGNSSTIVSGVQSTGAISKSLPIGFTFIYGSKSYTNFKMTSEGYITFDTAVTTFNANNDLSGSANRSFVAPLWDNLNGSPGIASYQLTGTSPNRVLTVEWLEWGWISATAPGISFQVKLYETTNVIEFVYKHEAAAPSSASASIGLSDEKGSGSGSYLNVDSTLTTPTVTSTTAVNNINTKPADNQVFRFTPPSCMYKGVVSASNITGTNATVSLSVPSTVKIDVYVSNTGAPASGATPTHSINAGATSLPLANLVPSSAYSVYFLYTCADGTVIGWFEYLTFNTVCGISTGFFESFENAADGTTSVASPPLCWTYIRSGGTSGYGYTRSNYNPAIKSGKKGFWIYTYNAEVMLVSPETNNLGGGTKQLRFSVNEEYLFTTGAKIIVYSLDGNTAAANKTIIQTIPLKVKGWVEYIIPLPNTTDDYFGIAAVGDSSNSAYPHIDDIYYEDLSPCMFPTNIVATPATITTTGATITWTASSDPNVTGYEYEVRTSGAPGEPGAIATGNSNTNSAVVGSLAPGTKYFVYVRSICNGSPGMWTMFPGEFNTLCDVMPGDFFEGFENAIEGQWNNHTYPDCWTYINSNQSANYPFAYAYQWAARTGSKGYYVYSYNQGNSPTDFMLISPQTNNLGNGTKQVRFYANNQVWNGFAELEIYTLDDNTATATKTLVQKITLTPSMTGNWTEFIVPLPPTTDDYFAFSFPKVTDKYFYLDDIYYEDLLPCIFPTGVTVSNIGLTGADVSWMSSLDPNVSGYEFEVLDASGTVVLTGTTATTSTILAGLNSGTNYSIRLRSECAGVNGTWSSLTNFMTLCDVVTSDFFEDLESYNDQTPAPTCWTLINNETNPNNYVNAYIASWWSYNSMNQYYVYRSMYGATGADLTLISPETVDLGNGTKQIRFTVGNVYGNASFPLNIYTLNSNTASATKTLVQTINLSPNASWKEYTVVLPSTTDDYFAFDFPFISNFYYQLMLDDIYYEDAPPCSAPANITADPLTITTTGATINWSPSIDPSVTSYEYEVRTSGAPGSSTGLVQSGTTNTPSVNLTGLNASTSYFVYVRAICGPSTTGDWTKDPGQFYTECDIVTTSFFEGFESTPSGQWNNNTVPHCWTYATSVNTSSSYGYGMTTSSYGARTGNNAFFSYRYSFLTNGVPNVNYQGDVLLISPETDDLGKGTKRLRFHAKQAYSGTYLDKLEVYSMDAPHINANKTLLTTITITPNWQEYIVYFPVGTTDDYFAFSFPNDPMVTMGLYGLVDDVYYEDIPTCVEININDILVDKYTKNGFAINWKDAFNNSAAYEIEIRTDNGTPGTPGAIYTTTTAKGALSAIVSNLNSSTEYKIFIRSVCSTTDKSIWNKVPIVVKTLCDYPNIVSHTPSVVYCGPQKADLKAEIDTADGTISWYDKENDLESLFDGENFISENDVTQDRSFWLRSRYTKNDTLIQVGYGTLNSPVMSNTLFGGSSALKHQHIFTAQELKDAGLGAGPITGLQLDVVTTGTRTRDGFSISMGTTTQSNATTVLINNVALQQVYHSGNTQKLTVGLMTFNFSTPFIWDGSSNIVVQTNWSNEATGATNGALRYHNTPKAMTTILYTSDPSVSAATMLNTNGNSNSAPWIYATTATTRPNLGFIGVYECKSNAIEIPIKIEPKPAFELSTNNVTSCEGNLSERVTIATNLGGYDTFVWTPSAGVSGDAVNGWTFSSIQEQEYVLSAKQANGICESIKTIRVFAGKQPQADIALKSTYDLCKNDIVEIKALESLPTSVTIGAGLSTTPSTSPVSAFVQSAVFSKQQYIYSATELINQGFIASSYISDLSFETINSGASLSNAKYTIKMMLTADTSFSTTDFATGTMSTVYSKENHTHTFQGTQTFNLDSPFLWDGQSNVLVEITQEGIGNGNNAETYYSTVTGVNVGMYATSDTDENPLVGTATADRLNVKFGIKQSTVTWQPVSNLYLDAAATVPYTAGTSALKVYTTSSITMNQVYNAVLTAPSGCVLNKAVTVNVDDVSIPVILNQIFCETTKVTDIVVSGGQGAVFNFYSSATSTTPITSITQTGTYYVEAVHGVCKSVRVPFTVNISPLGLPTTQFTQIVCGGGTVSALIASGVNGSQIRWYDSSTSTTPLSSTQVLVDNKTYYASQVLGNCESGRVAVLVDINQVPPALTSQTISICGSLNYGNVSLNQISGSELVWYASATSQTPIPNVDQVVNGTYYVSQKVNGCESLRVQVTASSQASIAAPTATIQNICGSGTISQLVAQILPNATAEWYDSATATTPLLSSAVLVNGTYYVAQRIGNCVSTRTPVAVRVTTTSAPAVSSIVTCAGSTIADLSLPGGTGVSYKWYLNNTTNTPLLPTEILQSGHYFVTRVENGCESLKTQVHITVNSRPNSPVGVSPQTFDDYAEISYLIMSQSNVVWYVTYDDAMKGENPLSSNMPLVNKTTYYAVIIGSNGCPSLPTPIEVNIVLGLNNFDLSKLNYYPNPVDDILTISYTDVITSVEVFDLNGRMIMSHNFDNKIVQVDFSKLSSGTYMLNIRNKENSQFVKIVKK